MRVRGGQEPKKTRRQGNKATTAAEKHGPMRLRRRRAGDAQPKKLLRNPIGTIHLRRRQIFTILTPPPLKNADVLNGWSLTMTTYMQALQYNLSFDFLRLNKVVQIGL